MAQKILVVDDDPSVFKTLKAILVNAGYEVVIAQNGEECARKIVLDTPDLILLDIVMPKMDGYAVLISIKELKEMKADIPDIPVIVITGRDDEQARELLGKENIKDYIVKPFDLEQLLGKIKSIINNKAS
ncbi:MAG: response regulator transcription factor [Candidatus Omnitrophica bacterium]|nr:response regulator transcription factor [Candidatus Omnitrophota bacterium]